MEELRIERDRFTLAGSYSSAGSTVLVELHGAGEGTRESPLLRHLHELLPLHWIGVVTFDRRGEGESIGDATRGRFDLQAEDALTVLRAVAAERARPRRLQPGGLGRADRRDALGRRRVPRPGGVDRSDSLRADDEVEVVVVPGAEHDMTRPDGSFAPEYDERLVEWLRAL